MKYSESVDFMQKQLHSVCFAGSSTLLPFLYKTQTILKPLPRCRKPVLRTHHQRFTTSSHRVIEDIPFEGSIRPEPNHYDESTGSYPRTRTSTITSSERAVFDRIFKSLPKSDWQSSTSDGFDEDDDLAGDGDETLESIFNAAIRDVKEAKQQKRRPRLELQLDKSTSDEPSRALNIERFPPALREAAEKANVLLAQRGTYRTVRMTPKSMEDTAKPEELLDHHEWMVRKARYSDLERVSSLLEAAKTDEEVWRVIEKEAFSRVREMNLQLKEEEKKKKKTAAKPKGKRKSKREEKQQDSSTLVTNTSPTTVHEKPSEVSPLEILQTNYALHCLRAIRLFRQHFPASPFAMALLPQIKSLGPISYILGASTEFYNEMLYIRYKHHLDPNGVVDLIDEMIDQGIGTDKLTWALLQDGHRYHNKAMRNDFGPMVQGLTQLQGFRTGWSRWEEVRKRVRQENEMARQRKLEEDQVEAVLDLPPEPRISSRTFWTKTDE